MEKIYEVRISDTFRIEAMSREEAIELVLADIADMVDPEMIEVYEA